VAADIVHIVSRKVRLVEQSRHFEQAIETKIPEPPYRVSRSVSFCLSVK
jgi:hypothetical protein